MKILKIGKFNDGICLVVNKMPKITYEKIGNDYIGTNKKGFVWHKYTYNYSRCEPHAFGGREISLKMKDGSIETIKNHWWDNGIEDKADQFRRITVRDIESLKNCYVYTSIYMKKDLINEAIEDYFIKDKLYEYDDLEKWVKLQYEWYDIIVGGKKIPFLINNKSDVIEKYSKSVKYCIYQGIKIRGEKEFKYNHFRLKYMENGRMIKINRNCKDIWKESFPNEVYEKILKEMKINY